MIEEPKQHEIYEVEYVSAAIIVTKNYKVL